MSELDMKKDRFYVTKIKTVRDLINSLKFFDLDTEVRIESVDSMTGEAFYEYIDYMYMEKPSGEESHNFEKINKDYLLLK